VGDVWLGGWRRFSMFKEPEFLKMVELIRRADVGYVNMETSFLDDENRYPYYDGGKEDEGERHSADPITAEDLRWMGFDICSTAMNHSYDFGPEGIFSTRRVLDKVGFTHAGIGQDLDQASFPGFMQTDKGTVAIVSAYANADFLFQQAMNASRSGCIGKPGVNGARVDYVMDPNTWDTLKNNLRKVGIWVAEYPWWTEQFGGETFQMMGHYFVKGREPGTYASTQMRQLDLERNVRAVQEAAGMADWVIFGCHDHSPSTRVDAEGKPNPSRAVETFVKACMDAGADVYFGTGGAGSYQGIEIYRNKPIFWNIGVWEESVESMWRQPLNMYEMMGKNRDTPIHELHDQYNERVWKNPQYVDPELYWSGLLVTLKLDGEQGPDRRVTEIKLYPCDLLGDRPRAIRGRPVLATGSIARKVLTVMKTKSAQYGTKITIKDDVGTVTL
jgi:poly-gamma-glutamate synthesis protein (capsule biosynthesis protein)